MVNIFLENKSPQFTTPRVVYAIINQVFEIRIQTEDVEGEEIVYALLTNETLITAQITEKGLLTSVTRYNQITISVNAKSNTQVNIVKYVKMCTCLPRTMTTTRYVRVSQATRWRTA